MLISEISAGGGWLRIKMLSLLENVHFMVVSC